MSYIKRTYPGVGIDGDRLLDKFEVTPGFDNYTNAFDRAAFRRDEPVSYERLPPEEVGNYIPYDDHVVDDIANNPEELYLQDARFNLADRNPDAPFLASEAPLRNPNVARERLNILYNGSRSNTGEMPNHSELFIGDMSQDPRGWDTAPRFDKMREMLMGKKYMSADFGEKPQLNGAFKGGRAAVLQVNMGNNTITRTGDREKTALENQEVRKQLQIIKRNKAKIFDRQLTSIASGKNVSMGHPEYTDTYQDMIFNRDHSNLDNKNNVAMNDDSLAAYADIGDLAFGASNSLVNGKTMQYLSAEMASRAVEDHEYGTERQLSNKTGLAAGSDFYEAQQHVIVDGFHSSATNEQRKTKLPQVDSGAIFNYKSGDISYGDSRTLSNGKNKPMNEKNDSLHYALQDSEFNTSRILQNKKSRAPEKKAIDIISKTISNIDSRESTMLLNKKSRTSNVSVAEAQYKAIAGIEHDSKASVFNYWSL
jgi:hypothetical protein